METSSKIPEHPDLIIQIIEFVIKNIFGIVMTLGGIAYELYKMSGKDVRDLSRTQITLSVLLWILASLGVIIGLAEVNIHKFLYGLLCWTTPIMAKPISESVSIKATPITMKVLNALESAIDKYIKKKAQ
jgi:hypothetical protein